MRRVKLLSSAAMLLATGALAACGGGGGGSPGGGVVTPPVVSPVAPPATPPATPPAGSSIGISTPFAVVGAAAAFATGQALSSASVAVKDPDTASATLMRDLLLDGDETITVVVSANGLAANKTFAASGHTTNTRTFGARTLTVDDWREGADSFSLLDGLQTDASLTELRFPLYARLARFQVGDTFGYQVLGDRLSTAATTGFAQYGGEAAGEFVRSDGARYGFLGRAELKVDFSAGAVGGLVSPQSFVDAGGASANPGSGDLTFSFAGLTQTQGFTSTSLTASAQTGASGSVAGNFYDTGRPGAVDLGGVYKFTPTFTPGAEAGGVFKVDYTAGSLTGGFLVGRSRAFNVFDERTSTYPSFARILTGAAGATSAFHRNSLDTPGGGNFERVEITGNGTTRSGQKIIIAVDDSDYTIANTFTPASYVGPVGLTYLTQGDSIPTTDRPLRAESWTGGLLALPLYKRVNGVWTQATLAQPFEYLQTGVTPGVNASLFMVSGPRGGAFTGSARFNGDIFGNYQSTAMTAPERLRGEMRIEVDFGRSQIRGALSDLKRAPILEELPQGYTLFGDVPFSAPLSPSFVATVTPDRSSIIPMTGTVSGEFFGDLGSGPAEVGGVFALQSAQGAFSGVYIAGRNPLPTGIYSNITPQTFDGTGGTFFQAMGPATTTSLRWTRSGPGAGQSTATIAYTRDGLNRTMDVFSLIRSQDSLRFNQGGSILLEIVERVAGRDLNYAGLGRWNEDVGSSGSALQQNFVAFGQRATNMPTTGTASYIGSGQGRYLATGEDILAKGAFQLGANFSTGTVNGNLDNNQAKYALSFTAAIAADGFSGTFITGDHALTGDVKGFFAGPGAAEVAGTFRAVDSPSGRSYTGGFVAAK